MGANTMIKFVVLARRPSDWTKERFLEWWRGPHAEAAKKLPGLLGYTHGQVKLNYDHRNSEPDWDGLAELYFKDKEALDRMLSSPEWLAAIKDAGTMGGKRIALVMDEVDLLAEEPGAPTLPPRSASCRTESVLNLFDLRGKTALIMGGHGELAREMANTLAELGCNVILAARKEHLCVSLAQEITTNYDVESLGFQCDITREQDVQRVVSETIERFGALDILINNAGTFWAGPPEEIPFEGWKKVIDVNLTGTFLCCQAAARHMIQNGGGTIINIASSGGLMSFPPEAGELIPYTTTKAAIIKLTRDLAVSWARYGIRVNSLAPGSIDSGLTDAIDEQRKTWLNQRIPMGRFGRPAELAGAIAFLTSEASSFMTGQTLVIDGGQTIG
jgi:gluconate 5-dehydrogenase